MTMEDDVWSSERVSQRESRGARILPRQCFLEVVLDGYNSEPTHFVWRIPLCNAMIWTDDNGRRCMEQRASIAARIEGRQNLASRMRSRGCPGWVQLRTNALCL